MSVFGGNILSMNMRYNEISSLFDAAEMSV